MKRWTSIFFILCGCLIKPVAAQKSNQDWFTIKAFLPSWNNAFVQLSINERQVAKDTIKKDMFSFTGNYKEVQEGLLTITKNRRTLYIPLFIESGVIKIRDEGATIVPYNTPQNNTWHSLQSTWDSLIRQHYGTFETAQEIKRNLAVSFIRQNTASPISLRLLYQHFYKSPAVSDTLYYNLYQLLDTSLRNTSLGKKIGIESAERFATAIGRAAPAILLPDAAKQLHSVIQPSTYTLLNFWASWCLPCRREIPELQKLYKNFSSTELSIISISMDTNRAAWLNAIKTEGLSWMQLSDLKGWNGPSAKAFGIKLIPQNILLDANGIIIGKNLSLDQVNELLKSHSKAF
jgi:thiol-disulfide isomerase/thioredoxin